MSEPKIRGLETLSEEQSKSADRILELVAEWIEITGLHRWELTVTFVPTLKEGESEDDECRTWADTYASWFYQTIHITFYSRSMDRTKATEEDVEHVVVHELGHALVRPMEGEDLSAREDERTEFVVTNLERVLVGLKYREIR